MFSTTTRKIESIEESGSALSHEDGKGSRALPIKAFLKHNRVVVLLAVSLTGAGMAQAQTCQMLRASRQQIRYPSNQGHVTQSTSDQNSVIPAGQPGGSGGFDPRNSNPLARNPNPTARYAKDRNGNTLYFDGSRWHCRTASGWRSYR